MRINVLIILSMVVTSGLLGASHPPALGPEVLRLVPRAYDLNSPRYRDAKKELQELVADCGAGVVEGSSSPNRCSFQVRLDELFFTPWAERTGYVKQKDWAYQDGVTWTMPTVRAVPDAFDLRDFMKKGVPQIKKQQCGDCWAWATHHGLMIARAVHDQLPIDLSVQAVLSCSGSGSCGGGSMEAVGFLKHGLPLESEFPYEGSDADCKYSSQEIQTGWDGKIIDAPYVGQSIQYSLAKRRPNGSYADGPRVSQMIAAMVQWEAPLVVTVDAYDISGSGIYDRCSAIDSDGNHMVAIVGWDTHDGKRIAHVWNSWGQSHGDHGVSRIQWECGTDRLDRGLGQSARVVEYKSGCVAPSPAQSAIHELQAGQSVQIGAPQNYDVSCSWTPTAGLSDPASCTPMANPGVTTEYHLTATNPCGQASSMTLVDVWPARRRLGRRLVRTPFGEITIADSEFPVRAARE